MKTKKDKNGKSYKHFIKIKIDYVSPKKPTILKTRQMNTT